jgi:hypothetical protein
LERANEISQHESDQLRDALVNRPAFRDGFACDLERCNRLPPEFDML